MTSPLDLLQLDIEMVE